VPAWSATAAIRSSLVLAAALLAACDAQESPRADEREASAAAQGACELRRFEGSAFTACRYEARRDRIELFLEGKDGAPLRSLAALEDRLGKRAATLRFAMNAGMYGEDGGPIGLYVERGVRRRSLNLRDGPGNFHLKPNGVFAVDKAGRVSVTPSARFGRKRDVHWATQSGPMLLVAGKLHPSFDADGPSKLIRNRVGVAGPETAWFVISEEGVSFGRFARFFRDALDCRDALFLDGTVSSLWDRGVERQDGYSSLGPMIAVFRAP
jgi:uncharacterized protein YigE (DUF2233 family)